MVDAGIKQIRIPSSEFPLVQITTTYNNLLEREEVDGLHYDFRYRIVSEDKNRFSHWSEIIRYPMPNVTDPFPYTVDKRISISSIGNPVIITAVWTKSEERSFVMSNVSGNGTLITYTTNITHDLIPGDIVDISGVLPIEYNLKDVTVNTTPTAQTFTVLSSVSSSYVSGGTVTRQLSGIEKFINRITSYDIWIRWSNDNTPTSEEDWQDWQYVATTSTSSFSIAKRDSSVQQIDIAIQVPSGTKIRDYYDNKLTIFRKSHAV